MDISIRTCRFDVKPNGTQEALHLDGKPLEIILGSQLDCDLVETDTAKLQQLDSSRQRLIESRIDGDFTQPQSLDVRSGKQNHRGKDDHQFSYHNPFPLNGFPH